MLSKLRDGNFTSSEIVALTDDKKARTYIDKCNRERRLGRSLEGDVCARPLSWGKICEPFAFTELGTSYILCSDDTVVHPHIPYWCGTKDFIKLDPGKTVGDIKCPKTLDSFCQLVDYGLSGGIQEIRDRHISGEKYYWQLVSNAILDDCRFAELVVFCPYQDQLDEIREYAKNPDLPNQQQFYWIAYASDEELPYLIKGNFYKNINVFRFEVPPADKELLKLNVVKHGIHLKKY